MTGISPHRSGLYENRQKMRQLLPEAELIPKFFSRHGYWSAGSGKLLHYFIDARSWDEYFPPKETEDPFPRTLYPEKRPVSLPRGGPWQYIEPTGVRWTQPTNSSVVIGWCRSGSANN